MKSEVRVVSAWRVRSALVLFWKKSRVSRWPLDEWKDVTVIASVTECGWVMDARHSRVVETVL